MFKKLSFALGVLSLVLGFGGVVYANHNDVTICHATGSHSNPYVKITVDDNAVNGTGSGDHNRDGHHHGRDIIPPGSWDTDGRNWTAQGQAIWNNNCNIPQTSPSPSPSPSSGGSSSSDNSSGSSSSSTSSNSSGGQVLGATTLASTGTSASQIAMILGLILMGAGVWQLLHVPAKRKAQ